MLRTTNVLKQTELLGQQFEVYGTPQEPLFKAKDVAEMLGLTNQRDFVKRVDEDERCKLNLPPQGETWMLTENGLYEVLMQSRKPIAKQFKTGVKAILKEIRQSGGYITSNQEDTPELIMARALQVAQSTLDRHKQAMQIVEAERDHYQSEVKTLSPKAEYTDKVLQSTSTLTVNQIALELHMSAIKLNQLLYLKGVQYRQGKSWVLASQYRDKGYAELRTFTVNKDKETKTYSNMVWTEKGRRFIHSLVTKGGAQ